MTASIAGTLTVLTITMQLTLCAISPAKAMDLPYQETFSSGKLDAAWTQRVSDGNKLTLKDGWMSIDAGEESYGHIQRPLGVDCVTIAAKLAVSASMYVVWDADNWCGVGKFTPSPFGKFYSTVTEGGNTIETDHRGCSFWAPHMVRLQIGKDCIRFSYSNDGGKWHLLRAIERPAGFAGAPKLVAFGKHYPPGMRPFGDMDAAQLGSSRGGRFGLSVSEIHVDPTPAENLRMTADERKELANTISDRVGHAILSRPEDPTYASVSKFLPPMKFPREVVGVPEHPLDIGVDYFGRLDVGPWAPPIAWFEIGDQKIPFAGDPPAAGTNDWWRGDVKSPSALERTPIKRRLLDGCLPLITLTTDHDGVQCELTVYGWSEEFSPEKPLHAFFRMRARASKGGQLPKHISLVYDGGAKRSDWEMTASGRTAEVCARFKYPEPATAERISSEEFNKKAQEAAGRWRARIKPAAIFEIPDKRVSEAYRAWFTYSFLNADRINGYTEIHDGAGFYEQIFGHSMALHVIAMDMWGLHDYAARLLDTQLHFQQESGLYVQACGLADHGALLMALANHYNMTGDDAWLKRVTPQMVKACDWLSQELGNTPKEGVTRGLIKFRPYNDYPAPVFNYMGNVVCAQALKMAAEALRSSEVSDKSDRYASQALKYRRDILDSMEAAAFRDGDMMVPPLEPDTHRLLKLGKYRGGDHYGLVVSMLLENDFLEPWDKRTSWYVDMLEKRKGLVAGVCDFMESIDHAYTYGYLMTQMERDDIRKVILGFWSMMAYGMTRDTYSPVEVSVIMTGENHLTLPHSYSLTQQFRLLRNMLIWEDGDTLRIGDAIPREWLQAGKKVAATDAPTVFGPASFSITSNADGTMRVRITPPTRQLPSKITVRLRHPGRNSIAGVTPSDRSDGSDVRFAGDTITLTNRSSPIDLIVRFAKGL